MDNRIESPATTRYNNVELRFDTAQRLMTTYKAQEFNTRKALEDQIISDFGKTVDVKDAEISGTIEQLKLLGLSHGKMMWGVVVKEKNYKVNNTPKVKRGIRGKRFPSKINGQVIK